MLCFNLTRDDLADFSNLGTYKLFLEINAHVPKQ